jgi:hypothetical protein
MQTKLGRVCQCSRIQKFERFFRVWKNWGLLFWSDRWINGFKAEEIASMITSLVPTRKRNIIIVSTVTLDKTKVADVAGTLTVENCVQSNASSSLSRFTGFRQTCMNWQIHFERSSFRPIFSKRYIWYANGVPRIECLSQSLNPMQHR